MRRVFTSADPVLSGLVESLLTSAGIACLQRNWYLGGAVGELPPNECWPEIWILDDADGGAAARIIDAALHTRASAEPAWTCDTCGEVLEGQFRQCWNCGAAR